VSRARLAGTVHRTALRGAALRGAALLGVVSLGAGAAEPPADALTRLFYDFEVAAYCSLVDERVGAGFRRQAQAALEALGLSPAELDRVRGRAWQAAHAEWQNRGLGGFRGWCRAEGRAAARRFAGPDAGPGNRPPDATLRGSP
jgi:hypothetical protein